MKYPKRSQYKHAKSQYRVRNWPEYEDGLRKRGDLTVWLSDEALEAWRETPSGKTRRPAYLCGHRDRGRVDDPHGFPSSASPDRGLPTLSGRDARGRSPSPRSHHAVSAFEEAHGFGAWLRTVGKTPSPEPGSRHSVAVRHPEVGHRVENLAREPYLNSLSSQGSTPHASTDDRLVSVHGILDHAAFAVA